ncbi:eukaryotic membrane protein family-domain-containing protein [Umbelopsis sp. PMI_123]|nr:eukaryotic membrane protein family-domain-containing protein [Umbelopsis sp. PMI_123]
MAPPVVSGNTGSLEQKSDCSESVTIDSTPRNTTTEEDIKELPESKPSFSIWDYLKDELTASDFDSAQDLKRERVTNLLGVPGAVEKLMSFGLVVCLDSFLYTFTILPLRFFFALVRFVEVSVWNILNIRTLDRRHLKPSQKCDLLKGLLLILTYFAMRTLDASRMYHSIRGQAVLKLYMIFNVLEICDKLCCSIGSDILDALFSKTTLGNYRAKRHLRPLFSFTSIYELLMTTYIAVLHTLVLFIQMITLNVAINFYSNALLTLLISNQFVEIKQSVFKKFEKENLFQLSCSDISPPSPFSILPSTFVPLFKLPTTTTLDTLMTPVVMVIVSELIVDWLKHAFITKFNQIRPSIYSKYIDILCRDLVVGSPGRMSGKKAMFVDQAPMVSRRIGFPALPMACLVILIVQQLLPMLVSSSSSMDAEGTNVSTYIIEGIAIFLVKYCEGLLNMVGTVVKIDIADLVQSFLIRGGALDRALQQFIWLSAWILGISVTVLCLIALKVLVGINLLGYAYKRYASMQDREEQERKTDEQYAEMNKDEKAYKSSLQKYLNDENDNILGMPQQKYTLDNVDRFSMVRSRIP